MSARSTMTADKKNSSGSKKRSASPSPSSSSLASKVKRMEDEIDEAAVNVCYHGVVGISLSSAGLPSANDFVKRLKELVSSKVDEVLEREDQDEKGVNASEEIKVMAHRMQIIGANMDRLHKLVAAKKKLKRRKIYSTWP